MGSNEEAAADLESHARQLFSTLEHFKDGSVEQRRDSLTTHINQLQLFVNFICALEHDTTLTHICPFRVLQQARRRIEELNSSGVLSKAFSASGRAEELKGYQETIRTALEQTQVREHPFFVSSPANLSPSSSWSRSIPPSL